MNKIETARYVAKRIYASDSDGTIQIDDNAEVAPMPHGMWVQTWVFVSNDDIGRVITEYANKLD